MLTGMSVKPHGKFIISSSQTQVRLCFVLVLVFQDDILLLIYICDLQLEPTDKVYNDNAESP